MFSFILTVYLSSIILNLKKKNSLLLTTYFCLESYYKLSISGIIFMKNAFEVGQFLEIYSLLSGLLKMLKFRTDGQLYNRSTFQRASKCSYNVSTLGLKGSEHSLCMSLRLWKLNYRVLLCNKVLEARTTNLLKSSKQKYLKCSQPKMFKYIKMHFKIITSWTWFEAKLVLNYQKQ